MVALTSGHQLPYPTGADAPCDSWETWKAFAELLDTKLTALNGDIDRTSRVRPMAKVSTNTAQQLNIINGDNEQVVFDTVEVDTDSMVDLTLAPTVISVRRSGIWMVQAYVGIQWQPLTDNSLIDFYVRRGSGIQDGGQRMVKRPSSDIGEAGAYTLGFYCRTPIACANAESNPYAFTMYATAFGPALVDPTVTHGELSLTWMADL